MNSFCALSLMDKTIPSDGVVMRSSRVGRAIRNLMQIGLRFYILTTLEYWKPETFLQL